MAEKDVFYQDSDYLLREFYIRKKGKGNALNEGLCHARNDLVCILDADCVLQEDALSKAVKHFRNDEVVAVCYTGVPHSIKRLLHQRDRWQRGLMDCLIKHYNMIANPHYGLLGLVTMCYQFVIELLGPIFWVIYTVLLIDKNMFPFCSLVFAGYALAQIGLTIFAAYIDTEKNMRSLLRWIPKLILITIEEIVLQIPIMVARVVGMLTFHWRRIVW